MPAKTTTSKRLEAMMSRAEAAMKRSAWFEAERLALKALEAAREVEDFDFIARVCLPLQESRRQRMLMAIDAADGVRIFEHVEPEPVIEPGIIMVRPPAVAADARRLRIAALQQEVPIIVLTREPTNQLGLCPIVAIGRITIRVRIEGPKNPEKPTTKWLLSSLEQLGDGALDAIQEHASNPFYRIDSILARLDSMPEHERMHQELAEACRALDM
jgi:hypothetical protein